MKNRFLWKRRRNNYSIQKLNHVNNHAVIEELHKQLWSLNQKISETKQELLKVHAAGIKAALSKNNNWFDKLQKEIYLPTIQKSSSFHRNRLFFLQKEEKSVQAQLDRLNGQFWKKKIIRWIRFSLICIMSIFTGWLLLLGLMMTLYLLPLFVTILLMYLFFHKNYFMH